MFSNKFNESESFKTSVQMPLNREEISASYISNLTEAVSQNSRMLEDTVYPVVPAIFYIPNIVTPFCILLYIFGRKLRRTLMRNWTRSVDESGIIKFTGNSSSSMPLVYSKAFCFISVLS